MTLSSSDRPEGTAALIAVNDLLAGGGGAGNLAATLAGLDPGAGWSVAWGNWLDPALAEVAGRLLEAGVELRVAQGGDDVVALTVEALGRTGPLVIVAGSTGFEPLVRQRAGVTWHGRHPRALPLAGASEPLAVTAPPEVPALPAPSEAESATPPAEEAAAPATAAPAPAPEPEARPKRVPLVPRPRPARVVAEVPKPAPPPVVMGKHYSFAEDEKPDDLPGDTFGQAVAAVPMVADQPDDDAWERAFLELSGISGDIPRRYPALDKEEYRDLLAYWAALLRHLQETAPDHRKGNFDDVFGRLTRFSKEYQPGFVWGLTRDHTPHSSSWYTDALRQYAALQQRLDPTAEEALEKGRKHQVTTLRKTVSQWRRKPEDPEVIKHVAEAVKRCYEKGMDKRDQELARIVRDVVQAGVLGSREFRYLREAVAALPEDAPEAAPEPALKVFGVCDNPECRSLAPSLNSSGLPLADVEAAGCAVCANSNGRRAVRLMVDRLHREAIRNLLVVGGMVDQVQNLERLLEGTGIELRHVDGKKTPTRQKADRDLEWADVLVIWPSGALHKVTEMFTQSRLRPAMTFAVPKGSGLGAFSRAMIEWLDAAPVVAGAGAEEAAG